MSDTTETSNNSIDSGGEGQLVVFALGDEEFGVDIHAVREIVRLPEITPVPRSPEYASGICNLRGSVLPVIDTRCRFAMEEVEPTDATRMLVVESQGMSTGIIVDGMREVLRLQGSAIEDTPGVCRGVDDEFLSGVVSLDKGKRLIMSLNLEQVIDIEIDDDGKGISLTGVSTTEETGALDSSEEEQLVSFQVGSEEYGLDINAVQEILRVSEITEVPNVPAYVKGLFTIRNKLMPVVDLRSLLGMEGIARQHLDRIDTMKLAHERWVLELHSSLENGDKFNGETDPKLCDFGVWIEEFNTASQEIQNSFKEIREPHLRLHHMANALIFQAKTAKDEALEIFEKKVRPLLETVLSHLDSLKLTIEENIHEDQRILVVDDGVLTVGYLVDHVNEVIRVDMSVINETPSIATTEKNEIRGVAKLDEGKRLILIMAEGAILSGNDSEVLADISQPDISNTDNDKEDEGMAEGEEDKKTLAEQSLEEEQLVTFFLDKEEYGLRIMEVQEINRLEAITDIPKAPSFIDGVTNLRGNIIPVLNIRNLFGLTPRDNDDKSRIIIVDIHGSKTGILVDQVNEVMRLSKSDIDATPAIISGSGNQFMDGICKLDGGDRMISMLNISNLLDGDELVDFTSMGETGKNSTPKKKKPAMSKKAVPKKKMKIAE